MATVVAGPAGPLDFRNLDLSDLLFASSYVETATLFRAVYGSGTYDELRGRGFAYDLAGTPVSGTIREIHQYIGGVKSFSATGLSMSVATFVSYVQSGDTAGALAYGLSANDKITGSKFADYLQGFAGQDTLVGGLGDDTLSGGSGDDTYVVVSSADQVVEDDGIDTVQSSIGYVLGAALENLTLSGTAAINATGNDAANVLTGNSAANLLTGLADNDTLDGKAGADRMIGGTGDDAYAVDNAKDVVDEIGGDGNDTVESSISFVLPTGVETLILIGSGASSGTGNSIGNLLIGNKGANKLDGQGGADTMEGGAGSDTYVVDEVGDQVIETIAGTAGGTDLVLSAISFDLSQTGLEHVEKLTLTGDAANDTDAIGNALDNTLTGNAADNLLDGRGGADKLAGGLGDDTYVVDLKTDAVSEAAKAGDDTVQSFLGYVLGANLENLVLADGAGDIAGTGNAAANTLFGNEGNNTLDGKAGNDTMTGGLGNDVYILDKLEDVVDEKNGGGIDTIVAGFTITLGADVENLTLTGASAIAGTGNESDNAIAGNSRANALSGLDGHDLLTGGSGNDTLTGGSGRDTLNGNAGADRMSGGLGDDTYFVDSKGDKIFELPGEGIDEIVSTMSVDLLFSVGNIENATVLGTAALKLTGNFDGNVLTGNAGGNVIDGGFGNDTMAGGLGNDTYVVWEAGDLVVEEVGSGIDTIASSVSIAELAANVENVVLIDNAKADVTGNALANVLTGNAGHNVLDGGLGADTLIGGAGNDTYVVDSTGDRITERVGEGLDEVRTALTYTLGANLDDLALLGEANANGTGNAIGNRLLGNAGDNVLTGLGDNDTLQGGAGNDTMDGGAGDDVYLHAPGDGMDTVVTGETGKDVVRFVGDDFFDWDFARIGDDLYVSALTSADDSFDLSDSLRIVDQYAGAGIAFFTIDLGDATNAFYGGALGFTIVHTPAGLDGGNTGSGQELIVGSDGNDTINGNGGRTDFLFGGAGDDRVLGPSASGQQSWMFGDSGNDTLIGGDGNDRLRGGAGDDVLTGGAGFDRVDYSLATAGVTVDLTAQGVGQVVGANQGIDILSGIEDVRGSNFDDTLTGDGGGNTLTGLDGDDLMQGAAGFDFLIGGSGNDTLDGGPTGDFDQVSYEDAPSGAVVNLSTEVQFGAAPGTALDGFGTIDLLIGVLGVLGSAFADTMVGGDGDEFFEGSGGDDSLDGGGGFDALDFTFSSDGVSVDLGSQGVPRTISQGQGTDVYVGFEAIHGSSHNDFLSGGSSDDFLAGQAGGDILSGQGGDDVLRGGLGTDTLVGGDGEDLADYADASSGIHVDLMPVAGILQGPDKLVGIEDIGGSAFDDAIEGDGADNVLLGRAGDDYLQGGAGDDVILGGSGDDSLFGDAGGDVLVGGGGNDGFVGGAGFDAVDYFDAILGVTVDLALEGFQFVSADQGSDGLSGIEDLFGSLFDDAIFGTSDDNILSGRAGDDTIAGRGGPDTIAGGNGDDVIYIDSSEGLVGGDLGADTLVVTGAMIDLNVNLHDFWTGFEAIDVGGTGANLLQLNAADVFQMSDTDELRVFGGTDDEVKLFGPGWTDTGPQTVDGQVFNSFTGEAGSTLLVDQDVAVTLVTS